MKKNNSFVRSKPLLVCSDLDKTLVGLRDFISECDLKALEFLRQKKVPLVFASGRCLSRITGLLDKYNLLLSHNSYLVGNNGGLIFNNEQQKVTSEKVFTTTNVQKIFALAKKLRCHLFARTSYDSLVTYSSGSCFNVFFWIYRWARLRKYKIITYRSGINTEPITQFVCWGREKNMHLFKKIMTNTQLSTFYPHHMWKIAYMDIDPWGVDKKIALEKIAQKLHIKQPDIVYAGDGHNDLEAIKWAGIGVTVSSAHEDIKKHAQIITHDQKNSGFAHLISRLFVDFQI